MVKGVSSAFTDSETENIDVLYEHKIEKKKHCYVVLIFGLV